MKKFLIKFMAKFLFKGKIIEFCYVMLQIKFIEMIKKNHKIHDIEIDLKMGDEIVIWLRDRRGTELVAAFRYDLKTEGLTQWMP